MGPLVRFGVVLLLASLTAGCGRAWPHTLEAVDTPGLTIQNETGADICVVHVEGAGSEAEPVDALDETETIGGSDSRHFAVAPGRYDVHLIDCRERERVLVTDLDLGERGARVTVRARFPE